MDFKVKEYEELAIKIANHFALLEECEAVAISGSTAHGMTDEMSDIDIYVFTNEEIALPRRIIIADALGTKKRDMGLTFWDAGDAWIDRDAGIEVDVIYWHKNWIEQQLQQLFKHYQAQLGYSTCFWHTVKQMHILYDRETWLSNLRESCQQTYPQQLKKNIITKNHAVLREVIPSYYFQIKKALLRQDILSVNHRLAAFIASYFDILFAINELHRPGEKRMLSFATKNCKKSPQDFDKHILNLLKADRDNSPDFLKQLDILLDALDDFLGKEGF